VTVCLGLEALNICKRHRPAIDQDDREVLHGPVDVDGSAYLTLAPPPRLSHVRAPAHQVVSPAVAWLCR